MASPFEGEQKQFGFVKLNVVAGKPRDVVAQNVGCRLGIGNLMPFGQSANGRRRVAFRGSQHVSPLISV